MTTSPAHILIADDQVENLLILEALLDSYQVSTASDGAQVLNFLEHHADVDLVLLDVMMPNLDGFEACRRIKANANTRHLPVLFLTSLESAADEAHGLSLGAEDFIHKPFSPPVVLARVRNHLHLARARSELARRNDDLEILVLDRTREIMRRTREAMAAQAATINAFCALAEARDNETGNHIRRTQNYVRALAERLSRHPRYAGELDGDSSDLIQKSAPLHDIGKVGIPDAILMKPGKLTPEEWRVMKTHCQLGYNAIRSAGQELGEANDFLRHARDIALGHHERWDGSGYPQGLAGDAIPLSARLMAVADVYDALISRRVYKPPFPHEQAIEMMAAERGQHFDPDILDALLADPEAFREIASRYADP